MNFLQNTDSIHVIAKTVTEGIFKTIYISKKIHLGNLLQK